MYGRHHMKYRRIKVLEISKLLYFLIRMLEQHLMEKASPDI